MIYLMQVITVAGDVLCLLDLVYLTAYQFLLGYLTPKTDSLANKYNPNDSYFKPAISINFF